MNEIEQNKSNAILNAIIASLSLGIGFVVNLFNPDVPIHLKSLPFAVMLFFVLFTMIEALPDNSNNPIQDKKFALLFATVTSISGVVGISFYNIYELPLYIRITVLIACFIISISTMYKAIILASPGKIYWYNSQYKYTIISIIIASMFFLLGIITYFSELSSGIKNTEITILFATTLFIILYLFVNVIPDNKALTVKNDIV